jgi:hypothetical protein
VRCLDSDTAIRSRGGKWCGSSVLSAQASRNGLPAARAGVQDVMPARRVLTRRGTAASVSAEFKTMALSFGAAVYKIPYCVQVRRLGLPCHRLWCVVGWRGRKVLAESGTFAGACSWAGWAENFGCLPPRSAFRTCPEATQWKVLVTFLSIWLCSTLCRASRSGQGTTVRQDGSDFWNPSQGGDRKCVATLGQQCPVRAMSQLFVGRVRSSEWSRGSFSSTLTLAAKSGGRPGANWSRRGQKS